MLFLAVPLNFEQQLYFKAVTLIGTVLASLIIDTLMFEVLIFYLYSWLCRLGWWTSFPVIHLFSFFQRASSWMVVISALRASALWLHSHCWHQDQSVFSLATTASDPPAVQLLTTKENSSKSDGLFCLGLKDTAERNTKLNMTNYRNNKQIQDQMLFSWTQSQVIL